MLAKIDEKSEHYDMQSEILDKLNEEKEKYKDIILNMTDMDIETESKAFVRVIMSPIGEALNYDAEAVKNFVKDFRSKTKEFDERIKYSQNGLAEIAKAKSEPNPFGISYLNSEMRINENLWRAETEKQQTQHDMMADVLMPEILSEYGEKGFDEKAKIIEASEGLGYKGNYGSLEGQKNLMAQLKEAQEKVKQLEMQNATLARDNQTLRESNNQLRTQARNLENSNIEMKKENEELKKENTKLKDQVKEVIAKAREYKDFVLQTIKEIPVIGKLVAKKVEKNDRALNSGNRETHNDGMDR